MRYWVGITDRNWFERLRTASPDEVNFWQPTPRPLAAFLEMGVPFLFKLHSPDNFVVGGGFFVRFSALPARLAWEAFGEKNGVEDYGSLRSRFEQYRGSLRGDPDIGCNVLNAPFFFERDEWISAPDDWPKHTVRGKTYDTSDRTGLALWNAVEARLQSPAEFSMRANAAIRYGAQYLARARLGQGAFRVLVTEAYERRCAITGERTLPVLEAAHIRPYGLEGPHLVTNGMLLRSDVHTLYDNGYLTVTEDFRILVSGAIREKFSNGREYYAFHGKPLTQLPSLQEHRPSADFLRWHNE